MSEPTIQELTAQTISEANSLSLKPGQEAYIAPETYAHAEQDLDPAGSWPRVAVVDGHVVGYLMGTFDEDAAEDYMRAGIWRVNVDAPAQGGGVGRFLVEAFAQEAKARGFDRITVVWAPGERGPGGFFEHVGFRVVGQTKFGENLGELRL